MDPVRAIADAVLYEGYILWPYRRSALKNQRRFTFGGVYPPAHSERHPDDPSVMRTECLVEGDAPAVEVRVRFLHVVERQVFDAHGQPVDELIVDGERYLSWQEAAERELAAPGPFAIAAGSEREELGGGGAIVRSWEALRGTVEISAEDLGPGLRRLRVAIANTTAFAGTRDEALRRTLCSTHTVLRARRGAFVSLTDPPAALAEAAAACRNEGTWPVLVGEPGSRDTLLSSPIILEDHPRIATESPGDLFDGGEIDQLLTLNILSLTDAEKAEMRASDPRARAILERTEALTGHEIMRLGGRWEELERPGRDAVTIDGVALRAGSRVALRPRAGGDIFDLALAGRTAIVESIEEDTDGNVQLAVTVEDDPGRDLGVRRQPGHRFFFAPEEVEPLPSERAAETPPPRRVLVAGIGNVFLGDDGFGVALAGRLERRELPAGVDVVDFGIRGMDLAYAMDGYDAVVLLDASPRGEPPGTLYVIEPDVDEVAVAVDAHGMDPLRVLGLARAVGGSPPRTLVVGCEPQTRMTGDEEEIVADLSEPVRAALDEAVRIVEDLLDDLTTPQEEGRTC